MVEYLQILVLYSIRENKLPPHSNVASWKVFKLNLNTIGVVSQPFLPVYMTHRSPHLSERCGLVG